MSGDFYAALQEAFRGSESAVRDSLLVYQPLLEAIRAQQPTGKALDLGCGRGEWLQFLSESGFEAAGCDLDAAMLVSSEKQGLNVVQMDAVEFLQGFDDCSISLISAFHLVEHLETELLLTLVQESHRVLTPTGVLLLETPNPGHLLVSMQNFYLDPTHRNPIPSDLLAFILRFRGFADVTVAKLHPGGVNSPGPVTLREVFVAGAQDYACLASKEAAFDLTSVMGKGAATRNADSLDLAIEFDAQVQEIQVSLASVNTHLSRQVADLQGELDKQRRSEEELRTDYSELMSVCLAQRGRIDRLEAVVEAQSTTLQEHAQLLKGRKIFALFRR